MSAETHVQDFLLTTDPQSGLRHLARLIVETLTADARSRRSFANYLEWASRPPLSRRARSKFAKTRRSSVPLVVSRDAAESTLLAVGFLWMLQVIPAVTSRAMFFERLPTWLRTSDKYLGKLEPDFLGELLLQTDIRATENSSFARRLDNAARSLHQELLGMRDLVEQVAALPKPAAARNLPATKLYGTSIVAKATTNDILGTIGLALLVVMSFGLGFSVGAMKT